MTFRAYAAYQSSQELEPFEYEPAPLGPQDVEIDIHYCGICYSDVAMIGNSWKISGYPLVPGHEVAGTIAAVGPHVGHLQVGQKVGMGWFSSSCMICSQCMSGNHNLCPDSEQTIVGRPGGFAEKIRCHSAWVSPIPDQLDLAKVGPLFCGGITVFGPIAEFGVKPTDRVGVVGIGGLGHLALQFLNKWGCEVTAFTSSDSKRQEARRLGAHRVVDSTDPEQIGRIQGSLDLVLSTVMADLDWEAYLKALAPKGRLHTVGTPPNPIPAPAFQLIEGQKSISGSPLASPATVTKMLDFCARHDIAPVTEHFEMSQVNDALEHLRAGRARYRLVLHNDIA